MATPENQLVTSPQQVEEYRLLVSAGVDPDIAADTIVFDNGIIADELGAASGVDQPPEEVLLGLMAPANSGEDRKGLDLAAERLVFLSRAAAALGFKLVPSETQNG